MLIGLEICSPIATPQHILQHHDNDTELNWKESFYHLECVRLFDIVKLQSIMPSNSLYREFFIKVNKIQCNGEDISECGVDRDTCFDFYGPFPICYGFVFDKCVPCGFIEFITNIKNCIESAFASSDAYQALNLTRHRGIYLQGPPGTGKKTILK
jgi:hypothetical protein